MLTKLSVRRPYTVFVAVVIVIVLGVLSFQNMSMDFLPSMELPYAVVMTTYAGASPEEVERAVTVPVEQAMSSISNVKEVQSMSINNMSVVIMQFNDGTDMGVTTVDMRESLDQVTTRWDDAVGSPTIMKLNPDMMPIMVAALDFEGLGSAEVTKKAENDVIPDIESVEGVASANISGAVSNKIEVIIQQKKIDRMNKKVKKALNGKFADAEKKLDKGKKKLDKGKNTLSEKKDEAADKISQGEAKLNTASEQIREGLRAVNDNLAKIEEQKKTLLDSEKEMKTGLATIASKKTELQTTVKTMNNSLKQLKELVSAVDKLRAQEKSLQAQIDALGDNAPAELKTALAAVQMQLQVVGNSLNSMGIKEEDLSSKVKELESGLDQAQTGLKELKKQKKTLKKGLKKLAAGKKKMAAGIEKLNETKKELENGKITTEEALQKLNKQKILSGIQMSVMESKMNSGSDKMDEAKKQFKEQKKSARENADLNNIITKEMVENFLKAENFDMPSGYVAEDDASYLVRVGDKIDSADNMADLVICDMDLDGLEAIKLGDVADVAQTDNSDDVYTVVNGNPAVLVTLQKQSGYSTGDVTGALEKKFEDIKAENEGLSISVLMNQGVYIDLVVDAVLENLLLGGILAIFILLFFLRSLRPTIIVACSIPLSVVAAVVAMYFSGVTLNIISLSGLALGVGMLVDNSVVVIENIFRMRRGGASAYKAAVEGAKQVGGAIIASTLTTVCVFAPIIFVEGITKQLFVDLALTLAYTLAASLLVALTLVPAMSSGLIRRMKSRDSKFIAAVQNGYAAFLAKVLRWKAVVLPGSVVLLGLFGWLAFQRGMSMMPEMESTQMTMSITLDKEKELSEVKDISNSVVEAVSSLDDVETVGAYTGSGMAMSMMTGGGGSGDTTVTMYAILTEERKSSNEELKQQILDKTKDMDCEVQVNASAMDMSALTGEGIQVQVKGKDLDTLRKVSEDVMGELKTVEGLTDISNGLEDSGEEFRISVDKAKAMKYSLTVAQVFQQIAGRVKEASSSSTVSTDTDDIGIYVKSSADDNLTRKDLKKMKIDYTNAMTQKKKKVKLSKIADFATVDSPNTIRRDGQMRYVNVSASIEDGYIVSDISAEAEKVLGNVDLPAGYDVEVKGEDASTQEAMQNVLLMMALGIVLMYLIMVAQFQSLLSPFIIMFTIPLAFTGGFMGLWMTGSDVSVIAMIGFVMLSGIIVNNGIVLVDYTNQLRRGGMEKRQAIVEAGRTRLRPILMTALTTILGLLPMVAGGRMGTDMTKPMAIVTIGGLIYGTLLTLFVVPCIYDLLNRKKDITERFDD